MVCYKYWLIHFNGKLISNLNKNAEYLNQNCCIMCPTPKYKSILPVFNFFKSNGLKSFEINKYDFLLTIKKLNTNKTYRWHDISVRMIQSCGKSLALPLKLLFKTILREEHAIKSERVQLSDKNYWSISLLSTFSKILEGLIFNSMFNYFRQNKL